MKKINYLVLIAVFVLTACSGGNTPSDAAKKMAGYMQSQNYEKFADGMAQDKNATAEEAAAAKTMIVGLLKDKAGKEIETKKGIDKIEILEEIMATDGETASVKVKYTYGNKTSEEQTLNFRKEKEEWKLYIKK